MNYNFTKCLDFTLLPQNDGQELHKDDHDSGGSTNYGIIFPTYMHFNPHGTYSEFCNLNKESVAPIYKSLFWNAMQCDLLASGVDLMIFDFGVTSGADRSIKILQKALNVTQDGIIGYNTIKAISKSKASDLINKLKQEQLAFYQSLQAFKYFGRGWTNRTNFRYETAVSLLNK